MDLVVFKVWMWDVEDYFIYGALSVDAHVGAHTAGVAAHAWGGELDAG